jgi:phosphoribosylformylglycinamidine cyclo-ligase
MDYKDSGVDIDAGNEVVRRIKSLARATFTPGVLSEIGSFGGLFHLGARGPADPVLVASADGVGTKLRVAFMSGIHGTIGADLVNHCVNDILVQGAQPLFFLDYLATGRLEPDVAVQVVEGLARACRENGCALLGGETAEMPGFYADGEYDVAGFIVGSVERDRLIDGRRIAAGDALVGLPSSGLHTNGYSLARTIVFDRLKLGVHDRVPELGTTVADALLAPHRSYLPVIRPLLDAASGPVRIKGMAHITGGGITDNLPRVLPAGTDAVVRLSSWDVPPLFQWLERAGAVPREDMLRTFNMGLGLILAVAPADVDGTIGALRRAGEAGARVIGEIASAPPGHAPAVRYEA